MFVNKERKEILSDIITNRYARAARQVGVGGENLKSGVLKMENEKLETTPTRKRLVELLIEGWRVNTFARLPANDRAARAGFGFLFFLRKGRKLLGFFV